MLIGNAFDYHSGHLNNISEMLDNYCIPLLPVEHRFYHSLFQDFLVKDISDIKYLIDGYDNLSFGMLKGFYQNIVKFLPEMNITYLEYIISKALKEN